MRFDRTIKRRDHEVWSHLEEEPEACSISIAAQFYKTYFQLLDNADNDKCYQSETLQTTFGSIYDLM